MLKIIIIKILELLCKRILKRYHPRIIGITGSVGKTSAKQAVAAVLQTKYSVRAAPKSYNTEVGVPLTVIGVECSPERSAIGWLIVLLKGLVIAYGARRKNYPAMLVLEMGADKPGDIQTLVTQAPCHVGVLTAITPVHTEFFKTIKKIAEEKRRMLTHLGKEGVAVINNDQEVVREQAANIKARLLTYGLKESAAVLGSDVKIIYETSAGWPSGVNFKVQYQGHVVPVFLPNVIGEQHVLAALAAMAVGSVYDINLVDAALGLEAYAPPPGRMRLVAGIKQTLLIDDSYNSSPEAATAALQALASIDRERCPGRRMAVLGDMLELGTITEQAHRELGFRVAEAGVDFLITVGEAAKHVAQAAREAGLMDDQIAKFDESVMAGRFLQEKLQKGDSVLIKGSRGMHLEKVVKEIMAEPERANELIVSS